MFTRLFNIPTLTAAAVLAVTLLAPGPAHADEIKKSKKKHRAIQMQIRDQEQKLKEAKEAEVNTLSALDTINRRLNEKRLELQEFRARLSETEKDIKKVSKEIEVLNRKIDRHKQWMSRKLRSMYRNGRYGDIILIMAASEDTSDLMKRWRYLEELAQHERSMIEDHRNNLFALNAKEEHLTGLRDRLASEEEAVRKSEAGLARQKDNKQQILATVKKKREAYEKMLKDLQEASAKLQKLIEEAEKKKKFASKGFRKLKGNLPWPLKGKVAIPYGSQKDPTFNTPVFRNGIYIAAKPGDRAKAVHAGRVEFADWFKGYGQLVIVNHGSGYHSLYANLSEIFLQEGDIIEDRIDIGKVGDSSVIDRPSLYFEIRYKGKPLDPEQWLKK
jgi:septal ring factor EnvC (AmiA/AmiB activator)